MNRQSRMWNMIDHLRKMYSGNWRVALIFLSVFESSLRRLCGAGIFVALLAAFPVLGHSASFDCGKAQSSVEKMICGDDELSKLDEDLAGKYKEKLRGSQDAEALKAEQKAWLKVRNQCVELECIKRSYKARLAALEAPIKDYQPAQTAQDAKPLYGFAADVSQALYGRGDMWGPINGRGYSVCEAYLKYLNTLHKAPVCEVPIPPGFGQPNWEELNVLDHLEWAYWVEQHFRTPTPYTPPDFATWRKEFLAELHAGKIVPLMRKLRTEVLPATWDKAATRPESVTLLAYTRDRDACSKFQSGLSSRWQTVGYALYLLTGNQDEPLKAVHPADRQYELLLYMGKTYFFSPYVLGDGFSIGESRKASLSYMNDICELAAYPRETAKSRGNAR